MARGFSPRRFERHKIARKEGEINMSDNSDDLIPCPFTDSSGEPCKGHIVRIEAYNADLCWTREGNGQWTFDAELPSALYHVFCSEKDAHADIGQPHSRQMEFFAHELHPTLHELIERTHIVRDAALQALFELGVKV